MQFHATLPGDEKEVSRRRHTRKRKQLLSGEWHNQLIDAIAEHFDPIRRQVVGKPDMSTNVVRSVVNQLSKLYHEEPLVSNEDGDAEELFTEVADAGFWQKGTRHQRMVVGLRESFYRINVDVETGFGSRQVTPDLVAADSLPDSPDEPALVIEERKREYQKKEAITWDVLDVRNPDDPIYKILMPRKEGDHLDLTAHYLGADMSGAAYPYRFADGTPFLPYVLYHAEQTEKLFDALEGREIFDGTLTVATYWTYFGHLFRDASWPQRYAINAHMRGVGADGSDHSRHHSVALDPATIAQFRTDGPDAGSLGQFAPGADVESMERTIQAFEARLAVHFDIGPDDFQRNGTAESGYAIALKRASVREAQKKFAPQFRRGDTRVLQIAAAMSNRFRNTSYPEDGYGVQYLELGKSKDERTAEREELQWRFEQGLASKVDMYLALNPGVTREGALQALLDIEQERRLLGAGVAPAMGENPNE